MGGGGLLICHWHSTWSPDVRFPFSWETCVRQRNAWPSIFPWNRCWADYALIHHQSTGMYCYVMCIGMCCCVQCTDMCCFEHYTGMCWYVPLPWPKKIETGKKLMRCRTLFDHGILYDIGILCDIGILYDIDFGWTTTRLPAPHECLACLNYFGTGSRRSTVHRCVMYSVKGCVAMCSVPVCVLVWHARFSQSDGVFHSA